MSVSSTDAEHSAPPVIDAIVSMCRTGTRWMDLPEHFGSQKGAHNRLWKWAANVPWEKAFRSCG
ncbi:transposase [Streptomyces sp. NRRL S-237]|uniref:transposase n=1 Tax=Streptomyces sp. NRRL S-237 TaxID=1463895 RepID=UPI003B6330B3